MNYNDAKQRLLSILKPIDTSKKDRLEDLKQYSRLLNKPDFIWHALLSSAATLGRSSGGDGLIGDPDNYATVAYAALAGLSDEDIEKRLVTAFKKAKARYANKKSAELRYNYRLIESMGGAEKVKEQLLVLPGRDKKMAFLIQFKGVGPKYARNIMMDVYHEDFRDVIAVDKRLKSIARTLGFTDKDLANYEKMEQFYLEVAEACNLNGWELDRILYWYKDDIVLQLER